MIYNGALHVSPEPSTKKGKWVCGGLEKNKVYYLRVRATSKIDKISYYGKWSKIFKIKIK